MDKLKKQLKDDAARIDVQFSDEFERRLAASLEAAVREDARRPARPAIFWWASSLTGAAAALLLVAVLNTGPQVEQTPSVATTTSPVAVPTLPAIDLNAETAMLTQPLEKELEDLKSDLKKAEEKLKADIGL